MSSSKSYLHLTAAAFSEMKVDDNAMDVTTFHLALLYFLLIRDFSTPQHSIRLLLFPYLLTRASASQLRREPEDLSVQFLVITMANSQVFLADLKAGRCSNVAEVQREARNVRKGGELTSVDMLVVDENFKERFACVLPAFSFYQRNAVNKVRFQVLLTFKYSIGYSIEDVHPNGGIKKFKSSVYSNFIFSFRLNQNWFPNPIVLKSCRSYNKVRWLCLQIGFKGYEK
ncbi:hypothetical protein IGI04_021759 [Brassica rapa subsp. trilocularis]|uniref:Uncharacterized protein n=1 Tax=Brassica rapa subsp. trilocularis TaxID=1813537 RepID=A0ABQ7M1G0_BRACM|nr:hypothetical protein IGI04_030569 [Brassica rapa subsp. trilocularis]KAG5391796.1 hypothetical protein IGI04_021759 [Brassica rapa subsp. trilocularis]